MTVMRAKMRVVAVDGSSASERLTLCGVAKDGAYPEDGSDEDNTFANWTPQADLTMTVTNPALLGKIKAGQTFYVDFTLTEPAAT